MAPFPELLPIDQAVALGESASRIAAWIGHALRSSTDEAVDFEAWFRSLGIDAQDCIDESEMQERLTLDLPTPDISEEVLQSIATALRDFGLCLESMHEPDEWRLERLAESLAELRTLVFRYSPSSFDKINSRRTAAEIHRLIVGVAADYRIALVGSQGRSNIRWFWENSNKLPAVDPSTIWRLNRIVEKLEAIGATTKSDGPVADGFRFEGFEHTGLNGKPWMLVRCLWDSPTRTARFSELANPVWGDPEELVSEHAIGGLRKRANKFFTENKIPFQIAVTGRMVYLKEKSTQAQNDRG